MSSTIWKPPVQLKILLFLFQLIGRGSQKQDTHTRSVNHIYVGYDLKLTHVYNVLLIGDVNTNIR